MAFMQNFRCRKSSHVARLVKRPIVFALFQPFSPPLHSRLLSFRRLSFAAKQRVAEDGIFVLVGGRTAAQEN